MSEAAQATDAGQQSSTSVEAPSTPAQAAPAQSTPHLQDTPAQASSFEFVPEKFRTEGWVTKYDSPEKLWEGISHAQKMLGQKQIVQGVQPPAADAPAEEWDKFHAQIGKPESADKYEISPDIKLPEGYDTGQFIKEFKEAAHAGGLNPKQAAKVFEVLAKQTVESHVKNEAERATSFDGALKQAFPENQKDGFALAKKGANALGIVDILSKEGLDLNPTVLQLCAKIGELAGEDTLISGNGNQSVETLLEEARAIQMSPAYMDGDKELHTKVEGMYKKVYG